MFVVYHRASFGPCCLQGVQI